ncbi:MAG: IS200/IS605 family transposase [Pseudomonadota bacterium]|nr:IS200/IS605 family transposase [Pseudomonadota bacterium]
MDDTSDYRRGRSVVYALHVHLVLVTKYRRKVLDEGATSALRDIFAKICDDFGAELKACDGEDDHVHLLVEYPPMVLLPTLVNSLKGVSSRLLRQHRPDIVRRYWKNVLWSPSYFAASCGGAPLAIIRRYVEQQRKTG